MRSDDTDENVEIGIQFENDHKGANYKCIYKYEIEGGMLIAKSFARCIYKMTKVQGPKRRVHKYFGEFSSYLGKVKMYTFASEIITVTVVLPKYRLFAEDGIEFVGARNHLNISRECDSFFSTWNLSFVIR